ncbi:hypothetical protein DNU06_13600 [Putridiphycobacter roseus]|uniref:Uncharacterized protein n=1 Tax=Putridiphycobacter roseus TaxID=2219161 RepID=A0A2W1NB99_9FLAO|nr:AsmA-like C-terminal region-containing protein [Putridiphycobacter roseus]PZE16343.1 hypothetical protein DNU06_13600 [Putridiphycobacter roseus]
MKKGWRILKKILIWGGLVFVFLITLITILLKIYEDDIEQYAITEINKHLAVKVDVQDMEVTFLASFPYASLNFKKILIHDNYETIESTDTLFYAKDLYLNFSLFDIYQENYEVKNITSNHAVLKIKTAGNGEINYNIVKPSKDTTSSNFKFKVEAFNLKNIRFEYANIATKQFYIVDILKSTVAGNFTAEKYDLSANAKLFVHQLKTNSFSLLSKKSANLVLGLKIDNKNKSYYFTKGDLTIEKMPFHIKGMLDSEKVNLNIKGDDIDLDQMSKSILNQSVEIANDYEGKGVVNFTCDIKGPIVATEMPSITADFSIANGEVKHLDKNLSITKIKLNGHYQNGQNKRKEELVFSNLSLNLLGSAIQGNTTLIDFAIPTFKGNLSGDVNLQTFNDFFQFKSIKTLRGQVVFNTNYAIKFEDIQYNPEQFDIFNSTGNFNLKNVAYQGLGDEVLYQNINGEVVLNGDDAAAKNITVNTQNSDMILNGALKNFIPFVEGNSPLGLIATLESDFILLDDFLGDNSENANNAKAQSTFSLTDKINLNLDLSIKNLKWANHSFNDIDGKLIMSDRKITVQHFNLKTLSGDIAGNLKLNNYLEKGNAIEGKLRFNGIDVHKLFKEWDNFDQVSITSDNIEGNARGEIDMYLYFDQYFNIDLDKIVLNNKIEILDGVLKNLSTMKAITGYMRTNKALKLALNKHIDNFESKLMHIDFKTLKNDILIENSRINIPKMDIASSAMDLSLSGWHDFNNQIDYHFSFRFRELKTIPEYTEFGKVEDDGLGWKIYLAMYGDLDDPSYKIDKEGRQATVKENVAVEKVKVKSMLKSELGLFGKDSTVKRMDQEKKKTVEFIMYDENQEKEELNPGKDDKKKSNVNKRQSNKFFERLKQAELKAKEKKEEEIKIEN